MFVLYYKSNTDYGYSDVELIYVSEDKSDLDIIRDRLIKETTDLSTKAAASSQEIYKFYTAFDEKVKVFLTKNQQFIKNAALPVSDKVWNEAHNETKDFFRNQAAENRSLIRFFYPDSKTPLSDIIEIDKVFHSDIPQLGVPPERFPFPDIYYCEESLVIDEVTVI